MTKQQKEHLKSVLAEFVRLGDVKYRAGADEHGDFLGDLSAEVLCDQAIGEAIDQIFYLFTLKSKLTKKRKGKIT